MSSIGARKRSESAKYPVDGRSILASGPPKEGFGERVKRVVAFEGSLAS